MKILKSQLFIKEGQNIMIDITKTFLKSGRSLHAVKSSVLSIQLSYLLLLSKLQEAGQ